MDKVCAIDWGLILEYFKIILSWPPMALVIVIFVVFRFQGAIEDLIRRLVGGKFLGQEITAVHPKQMAGEIEDGLAKISDGQETTATNQTALPPELVNDPNAPAAIEWVRNNPELTVVEYKKLMLSYGAERLNNRIYGTQVELLDFMAHCEHPVPLKQLAPFHEKHQAFAKSTEYSIKDYVEFLMNSGVIKCEGEDNNHFYSITEHGLEFLSYIKKHYPMTWHQRMY